MIEKLKEAGLGYRVSEHETPDKFGMILVYHHPNLKSIWYEPKIV